jgi:cation diffusion facilitator CzcD-associated flavoprotein CzcO
MTLQSERLPVGLAIAAHLIEHGIPVKVFEAGAGVAANLDTYRHVRLFSPWQYNIDRAGRRLLEAEGWRAPADEVLPTAGEVVDEYQYATRAVFPTVPQSTGWPPASSST